MPPTPVAPGLSLCDYLIVEERTHKVSLIGMFSGAAVAQVPTVLPPFCAYALLSDSEGRVPIELTITHLGTSAEVYTARHVLTFPDRLTEVHCIMRINDCEIKAPGVHQVTLQTAGGQWIAQQRLRIRLRGGSP
jgi:hypothetical protein